ncbi:hypothetical protein WJX75_009764 [Coccomyxa subellipsoidea]|uniref:SMP domain-containing protein n=1 Tax=Coccomyxa subellipsoidea TaxID=248742 RepID=A0ABR2YDB7_9CHLO
MSIRYVTLHQAQPDSIAQGKMGTCTSKTNEDAYFRQKDAQRRRLQAGDTTGTTGGTTYLAATNQSDATSLAMANNLAVENMLIATAAAADTTVQDSAPDVTYSSVDTGASSAPTYTYDSGNIGDVPLAA